MRCSGFPLTAAPLTGRAPDSVHAMSAQQSAIIRPWNPVLKMNPFAKYRIADYGDFSVNPLSIEDTFRRVEEQMQPFC